jgi:TPP-dependent pyruvate/acetoin dehydrogenase alpha subunit
MSASMTTATLGRETSLSIFERMLAMRHFEEAVIRLYNDGRFVSHYHVYIGQEATGAAVLETLGDEDRICTTHRNHGHIVGRGSDPGRALAEILGRASGFNGGRSGTLHLCDPGRGFLSTSGIVGGCAGLATGAAYGIKVKREPHVAVGFFGDGALEEGLVLESFNLAALWKLPVVYVCENNSAGAIGPQQGGYPTAVTAVESFTRCRPPTAFTRSRSMAPTWLRSIPPPATRCSIVAPVMVPCSSKRSRCAGLAAARCGRNKRRPSISTKPGIPR